MASLFFLGSSPLKAQTVLNIWPGKAPGSEHWTQQERRFDDTPVGTVIQNVVTPTLTAYLPDRETATGTGIIIAPGGGFVALAVGLEGEVLAKWFQERGVAAFVLKYRTIEKKTDGIPQMDMDTAGRYGIADGIQAIKVVRSHTRAWGVQPGRVGFIGFSAGGMIASAVAMHRDTALRPSFAAIMYGAPFGVMPPIPHSLPPLFMAWAKDDRVALTPILRFRDALAAAHQTPEIHEYETGGHGFGMRKQGTASDAWTTDFMRWLQHQGLTQPDPVPAHEAFIIQSRTLGESRQVNVYVPSAYRASRTPLPALYMPDGGLDEDFPHVVNTVDSLIARRAIPPMLVVGIPNTQRRRDLTGPTRIKTDSAIAPRVGGSAAFHGFVRTELIPEVERRYRTTRERTLMGESLAGLYVLETYHQEPGLFSHYIAFDPSLWWNAGALVDSITARPATQAESSRTLYLAHTGEPSTTEGSARVARHLHDTPQAVRVMYSAHPELTHANIFRGLAPQALVTSLGGRRKR